VKTGTLEYIKEYRNISERRIKYKVKRIILCLLITLAFVNPAYAYIHGIPMYCRTQIEYKDKENVMRQIIKDMNEEGYKLKERSSISLLFETSLHKANRFNYATTYGHKLRILQFSPPVYQLNATVVRKTTSSVEVEITPIIILNPDTSRQKEIYEDYIKTQMAINEYLSSLKDNFEKRY